MRKQIYRYEFLKRFFFTAQDKEGRWRLFHAVARGSKDGRGSSRKPGDLADTTCGSDGYRVCNLPRQVGGVRLYVAPVIWCLFHQTDIPSDKFIDHENRDKLDNDPIHNLRLLTQHGNAINRAQSDNRFIGVRWIDRAKSTSKHWWAVGMDPSTGKNVSLKFHHTPEDAARAYDRFVRDKRGADAITNESLGRL